MADFTINEGGQGQFTYSFSGLNPIISVEFVEGTATATDGFGGRFGSSSTASINGYVFNGVHTIGVVGKAKVF